MASFYLFLRRNTTALMLAIIICVITYLAKGFFSALATFVIASAILYGWYRLVG